MKNLYIVFISLGFLMSCQVSKKNEKQAEVSNTKTLLERRYQELLNYPVDSMSIPRSYTKTTNEVRGVASKDWTSGFFPGNLWQLYLITGKQEFLDKAETWTSFIEKEKFNNNDHDIGFKVYSCFGTGYKVTGKEHYKDVIIKSAKTLCTRYSDTVGAIRSWDFNKKKWQYPVIIDNMINLELLFEASEITGDSLYHKIAVNHANTTLKNHFRPDNSVYHVIDYNPSNGEVRLKNTHQGLNDNSTWARGQAWAIYGFSMAYRYTNDQRYLDQAIATANFYLEHENLPEDGIAYWDFDDPKIPNTHKDVSASAVVCSALYEIYGYTKQQYFLDKANLILASLMSDKYVLDAEIEAPFILDYSTGNKPKEDELDEPIVYGDYYFLEALVRKKLKDSK
ncbi:Rhamnogalacturonyl hydrolase YesR [Lutibacter agarilyticus]|uniref:Rhamnogalacturonyl hydrolase YesR n=1 Tax=Lutibacter agarilyticus TaxID=1109740 RepID=A0A238Y4W7_9FLAO|nr:glycoside hydrolase family 88 protein [Lutibacter agarilyticus]SNR66022.1 Rhamnogalacturonyl hydrolase YesR [Lutibacter agarilyticus]